MPRPRCATIPPGGVAPIEEELPETTFSCAEVCRLPKPYPPFLCPNCPECKDGPYPYNLHANIHLHDGMVSEQLRKFLCFEAQMKETLKQIQRSRRAYWRSLQPCWEKILRQRYRDISRRVAGRPLLCQYSPPGACICWPMPPPDPCPF